MGVYTSHYGNGIRSLGAGNECKGKKKSKSESRRVEVS
jgi:hypothetical protein